MKWFIFIAGYLGAGLLVLVFTMARLEIILAVRESVGRKLPLWFKALAWGLILGASILLWPVLLKGWFTKAQSFRGIFPGGDGYQLLHQRLRMMDGVRREMDGYLPEPIVSKTSGAALEPDTYQFDEEANIKGWLRDQTTVEAAEREHLVKTDRLGPNPVPFGFMHGEWLRFKGQIRQGDQLWNFCSSGESWEHLAGREGLCLVRGGEIVASIITCMN
jgi:hypothetical protein